MQQFEEAEQKIFNSRPLVEVDQSVRYIMWRLGRFQLTTSRGGRPSCRVHLYLLSFSTHDLSWRSTVSLGTIPQLWFFQLTTSRGGRRIRGLVNGRNRFFSTHDLSWRSTAKLHNKSLKFCIFSGHFILEQMSLPFSYKYH